MRYKKGQVGLDTAKAVMLALLVIGMIAFVIIVANSELNDVADTALPTQSAVIGNETLSSVEDGTGEYLSIYTSGYRNLACTIVVVTNASTGEVIQSGNYTVDGCHIIWLETDVDLYNNTDWNVTYTYTFIDPGVSNVFRNTTSGIAGFFDNVPTWFTLLSVVVIIAIIALVIIVVGRFGGKSGVGTKSSGSVVDQL